MPWGRNVLGAMQLQGGMNKEAWKDNVLVRKLHREDAWIGHWRGEGLGYSLWASASDLWNADNISNNYFMWLLMYG